MRNALFFQYWLKVVTSVVQLLSGIQQPDVPLIFITVFHLKKLFPYRFVCHLSEETHFDKFLRYRALDGYNIAIFALTLLLLYDTVCNDAYFVF